MTQIAQPSAVVEGAVLGDRFEILAPIGSGAMGAVFRALDRVTDRDIAVKVLHKHLVTSREYVSRFKREAYAASRFRHESAVRVIGTGDTDGGAPYIAMELVDGQSLKEIMESDSPLGIGRACNIAAQLLDALSAAHQRGIVHRDMKPDNVRVVVDEDGIERPKILDFGVAKFISGDLGDIEGAVKTKTGIVLGTPKYMAPEQIRGEAIDGRADLYAVGAMLYEMLSGVPPFQAKDVFGFVAMHLKEAVVPLTTRCPERDVPGGLDETLLHMLEKDPSDRPNDAADVAEIVQRWAIEDPRAAAKVQALNTALAVVCGAGVVGAGIAHFAAPETHLAAGAGSIGLCVGAAAAARFLPRPSVFGYAQRLLLVVVAVSLLGGVSLVFGASPGAVTTTAYGLAAVLSYAGYLLVWSAAARWLRPVVAGLLAPLLALLLIPVRVAPAGSEPYYVSFLGGGAEDLATLERAARQETVLAVLLVGLIFGLTSIVLPRPAAARL